ncbi:uncharacterized protein LOC108629509 [Ceratina calcarata]|uniref:Uncharacterized protein LOC108629509 n=1 Tax=Ceratina calcarata TaxID=156304 RepID=A0AAJ7J9V5_9HYME|nr:uncharacterized protein LOC108629509 [Ceratina calcarata]XP_017887732.1 uncharacterized protein LOC108629509 [Ceratina calcarata]
MGTILQQSVLKGRQRSSPGREKDTLHKLFNQAALNYSSQLAIRYEDDNGQRYAMSYGELHELTNKLARALKKFEKPEGSSKWLVGVCMKPSHRLPIVLIAIEKAGMAYLPLDTEFPMTRMKHILQEAQPFAIVIEETADPAIYEGTSTLTYNQLSKLSEGEAKEDLKIEEDPEKIAIVLYTSGSTGIPKGVLLPHATVLNRLQWQWEELPYAEDEEHCVFKTSLTFVDSVSEIWGPLLRGRTLIVVPKDVTRDPERFVALLEKYKIQRLVLVPSLLQSILMYLSLRSKDSALSSLRLWICSGETLPVSLAEQFFVTFDNGEKILANFYGSTEIMGDVAYYLLNDRRQLQSAEKVPIGKPLDNCIIYIVNKEMRLVPQGEVGELIVAGRNLATGYIRDVDSRKFHDNPFAIDPEYSRIYCTGDYARISKDVIVYEGRLDSQIKVRGHRVDLTEVEKAVAKAPGVDKAVVLCHRPGELSQTLIAFVTVASDSSTCALKIETFLQATLPVYMLPRVVMLETIPLLTNGKTDRQALLKYYEALNANNDDEERCLNCEYSGVPEKDMEKAKVLFPTVASVIGEGNAVVRLESNFYELGGNSLNSVYTVTKLRDQGYKIGITEFITAKNLAEVIDRMTVSTTDEAFENGTLNEEEFIYEMLNDSHKADAIEIITESFYSKADLEQWLMPEISREDYRILMERLWDPLVEKDLSFVVKSSRDGRVIGIGLNFDLWDEPEVILDSKLTIVFDFLEYLEAPIRERKLPKGKGQIIHNFMMGTSSDLKAAENVIIMREMEEYCLRLARRKEYAGIFTTNTSPLTQQLGIDVFGYETMTTYQVNRYSAPDGTKPFGKAPDTQLAICSLKMIA